MATQAHIDIDRARIKELSERESAKLNERTQGSRAFYDRARKSLVGGVASSYQTRDPWPIYLSHGKGAQVWDVDGNEYLDFHNGFGSMVQGHAHDVISKAVTERIGLGTHFAAPTEDAIVVGEELARRLGTGKSTVHRMLRTLHAEGFVAKTSDDRYRLVERSGRIPPWPCVEGALEGFQRPRVHRTRGLERRGRAGRGLHPGQARCGLRWPRAAPPWRRARPVAA